MAVRRIDDGEEFASEYRRCRDWLIEALNNSSNPDEKALLDALIAREFTLWTAPNAVAVTHITNWDNRLTCVVVLAGGDLNEIIQGGPCVSQWAKEQGCKAIVLFGRKGWERALAADGYRFSSIQMMKEING